MVNLWLCVSGWINNVQNFYAHKGSQLVSLSSKKSKNNSILRDCRRNRGEHARKYYVNSSNFMLSEFIIITNTTILLSLDVYWNKFINFSSQINLMIFLSRRRFDQSYESSISLSPLLIIHTFFSRAICTVLPFIVTSTLRMRNVRVKIMIRK